MPVDLITAWAEMQSELSPEQIAKLINQYESKMKNQRKISLIQCRHFLHQVPSLKSFPMINFAGYSMRVKESLPEILGLDTVKQYTGYLDIDSLDKHLFYWF